MKLTLKISYIMMLLTSILLYAIPFEFGGNLTKTLTGIVIIGFSVYAIIKIWTDFESSDRFHIAILLINTLAVLHFSLIFLTLVIEVGYATLFIAGIIIASILFYYTSNRMQNYK